MQIIRRRDVAIVRARESVAAGIVLLAQTVLRIEQRAEALPDVIFSLEVHEKVSRDILKLVSHHVAAAAQLLQSLTVVELGRYVVVTHGKGRSVVRRIEAHGPRPEHTRLLGNHQPELASAYDSYRTHYNSAFITCSV